MPRVPRAAHTGGGEGGAGGAGDAGGAGEGERAAAEGALELGGGQWSLELWCEADEHRCEAD